MRDYERICAARKQHVLDTERVDGLSSVHIQQRVATRSERHAQAHQRG